ncbi:Era-like GTP-binding protein [Methanobrevibacter curvatus]|uniref:tRNA modification GTPase MnmE n=1 Tax=Methanobrevibacter curvatus TaxID=49547 RepID=A0A162FMR3_9EURY|nr:Era-like GTP-binding protein [Methanobrevibacter curvatus]KZX12360.1 tRNA modification GTPase MnmE [Methanobrevibacter curvatus]
MGFFDFIRNFFKKNKKIGLGLYGSPNSGKTTLANKIAQDWMGKEIGSASNVPHETRKVLKEEKVIIKKNGKELDFDIIDTPGISTKIDYHNFLEYGLEEEKAKTRAKEATKGIIEAIKWLDDVTGVLLVIDSTTDPLTQTNITIVGNLEARKIPFLIVANKIDMEGSNTERIESVFPQHKIVPISALNGENTDELYEAMFKEFA